MSKEKEAELLYKEYSSNHPSIHCNRFPSWKELKETEKQVWRDKIT